MPTISSLRIRHDYTTLTARGREILGDLGTGFTLETWVCPAQMDNAARLYADPGYAGKPVLLRAGSVPKLPTDRLPKLGSVDLPEGVEAVFFAEENLKGEAWAIRDDQPAVPPEANNVRSVVILDRRHRNQRVAVLFSEPWYRGEARVLHLGEPYSAPQDGFQPMSAWLPPGVALENTQTSNGESTLIETLHGDRGVLTGAKTLRARLEQVDTGDEVAFNGVRIHASSFATESDWLTPPTEISGIVIPKDRALYVCTMEHFDGERALLVGGYTDFAGAGLQPRSGATVDAHAGVEGVLAVGGRWVGGRVLPPGRYESLMQFDKHVYVPPGYRLVHGELDAPTGFTGSGTYPGLPEGVFHVERVVGLFTMNGFGLVLHRSQGRLRSGGDVLSFGGVQLRPERWTHVALTYDGSKLSWLVDGRVTDVRPLLPSAIPLDGTWTRGEALRGGITRTGVWQVARSPEEVRDGRFPSSGEGEPGLLYHLPLNDCFTGDLEDCSGNGQSGHAVTRRGGYCWDGERGSTLQLGGGPMEDPDHAWLSRFSLGETDGLSVSLWVRPDGLDEGARLFSFGGECEEINRPWRYIACFLGPEASLRVSARVFPGENTQGSVTVYSGVQVGVWMHVALTLDAAGELTFYVNGALVTRTSFPVAAPMLGVCVNCLLGRGFFAVPGFRGRMAHLRVYNRALSTDEVSALPQADGPNPIGPVNRSFGQDAVIVPAILPDKPTSTVAYQVLKTRVASDHEEAMRVAHTTASALRQTARERANAQIALARDLARRHVHFAGLQDISFIRGRNVARARHALYTGAVDGFITAGPGYLGSRLPMDTAWAVGTGNGALSELLYIAVGWPSYTLQRVDQNNNLQEIQFNPPLASPPMALAVDGTGTLDGDPGDGIANPMAFWIDASGMLYSATLTPASQFSPTPMVVAANRLVDVPLPPGRPRTWNLVVDTSKKRLVWSNGWEIFEGTLDKGKLVNLTVLVPHAASPHPIAVAVDSGGVLLWVDAELGKVRSQVSAHDTPGFDRGLDGLLVRDLYPAPDPAPGLALGFIQQAGPEGTPEEQHFVYWVSAEEQELEVPVMDTPGRIVDIAYDPSRPFGSAKGTAEVLSAIGASFIERRWARLFGPEGTARFGPFSADDGVRIELWVFWKYDEHMEPTFPAVVMLRLAFESGQVFRIGHKALYAPDGTRVSLATKLPTHQWSKLEIEVTATSVRLSCDGQQLAHYKTPADKPLLSGNFRVQPCQWEDVVPGGGADGANFTYTGVWGLLAGARVSLLSGKGEPLAVLGAKQRTGAVEIQKDYFESPDNVQDLDCPLAVEHPLAMEADEDVFILEPVRLDLRQGFTASAELVWDGWVLQDGERLPQSVYELSTAEDEERISCIIVDGRPVLGIRWAGRQLVTTPPQSVHRSETKSRYRVTWALSPEGVVTTWIEGEVVQTDTISLRASPRVFTGHRLGTPNPAQLNTQLHSGLLRDDDRHSMLAGFRGHIYSFAAWNHYVPEAARGLEHTPPPDASWDRSLVTTRSRHRYLRVGRVDGSETPLALFPIDLDGGLALETNLHAARSRLSAAQAQAQAAEAHAVAEQAAALKAAKAAVEEASAQLARAKEKADADVRAAQLEAASKINSAKASLQRASDDAQRTRSEGKAQADGVKTRGEQDARAQETKAADDKRRKVAAAQSRVHEKRAERDQKQQEYANKRG